MEFTSKKINKKLVFGIETKDEFFHPFLSLKPIVENRLIIAYQLKGFKDSLSEGYLHHFLLKDRADLQSYSDKYVNPTDIVSPNTFMTTASARRRIYYTAKQKVEGYKKVLRLLQARDEQI